MASIAEGHGKANQREVRESRIRKAKLANCIQSTAGHVKSRGIWGGPPSKPKYYLVTDREEYCEGKVKRTPGGEEIEPETLCLQAPRARQRVIGYLL